MRAKLYWSEEMTPNSNSNPQEEIKRNRQSKSEGKYIPVLLQASLKVIITTMYHWVYNIPRTNMSHNNSTKREGNAAI